jgi:hypothetical protein
MKQFKILMLFFLLPVFGLSQKYVDTLNSSNHITDNKRFWFYFDNNEDKKLGLTDLLNSSDSLNIRIRSFCDVLDISLKNNGSLISNHYIYLVKKNKKSKPQKLIYDCLAINSSFSKLIVDTLFGLQIDKFRDGSKIPSYPIFVDGNTYRIQIATPTTYKEFTLSSPYAAKEIKEAEVFDNFIKYVYKLVDYTSRFDQLKERLKNGKYTYGGLYVYTIKR